MFSILKRLFGRDAGKDPKAHRDDAVHKDRDDNDAETREVQRDETNPGPAADVRHAAAAAVKTIAPADQSPDETSVQPAARRPKPGRRRKKAGGKKQGHHPPASPRNRHGIPVFKRDADISQLFEDRSVEQRRDGEEPIYPAVGTSPRPMKRLARPRNKNGIPMFDETADFAIYFRDAAPHGASPRPYDGRERSDPARKAREADDFQTMIEDALAGKTMDVLLREKGGARESAAPQSAKELIRRYPPPQEELDLHGHTAQEAVDRTRTFVERSRYRGKRTLLIIVGKGLHSEGKAILPDVVEAELARLSQEKKVLAHRWERGAKRKSGAIVVYLNTL